MIRVTHIIESFEQLQELTRNPKYGKAVFKTNKNKNLKAACKAWVYYKVDSILLNTIAGRLKSYLNYEKLPLATKITISNYYSQLKNDNPCLTVKEWNEILSIEKEFNIKFGISDSLKKEIEELCSSL